MNTTLTDAGRNLLLLALSGETITFNRLVLGDGTPSENDIGNAVIAVDEEHLTVGVSDGYASIKGAFNNSSLTTGFRVTEIGIYAKHPSDATQTVLYAVGVAEADKAT